MRPVDVHQTNLSDPPTKVRIETQLLIPPIVHLLLSLVKYNYDRNLENILIQPANNYLLMIELLFIKLGMQRDSERIGDRCFHLRLASPSLSSRIVIFAQIGYNDHFNLKHLCWNEALQHIELYDHFKSFEIL